MTDAAIGPWPQAPQVHRFDDELARLDAVATADALDARELSSGEVLAAAVKRARALEPQLHAIAAERFEEALAAPLPPRSRRGSLAGVPTFIKDMVAVAGLPLTWGSPALAGGPPAKRSRGVAADIERAGMVVLGVSAVPEFGFIPSTEFPGGGATTNPWNPQRTIGGSSGGSAALVSAGVVPMAHAIDGGGSTRIPAACAGLVGHKPTRGRLRPHLDEERLPVAVSTDGVLTRSVRDSARFYAELERVHRSRSLPPIGEVTGPPSRRLRIGVFDEPPFPVGVDAPSRATVAATADLLAGLGHHVEPVVAPYSEQDRDDFIIYFQFLAYLVTRTARLTHGSHVNSNDFTAHTRAMAAQFRAQPARIAGASRRLRRAGPRLHALFAGHDLLLTPTTATVAPPLGHLSPDVEPEELLSRIADWMIFTPVANVTGHPSISLPLGYDPQAGVPVGAMFTADHGEDALLLQLALELETARPWPGAVPVLGG